MNAEETVVEAARLGIRLTARDGYVVARPGSAAPPQLIAAIRQHKTALLEILADQAPDDHAQAKWKSDLIAVANEIDARPQLYAADQACARELLARVPAARRTRGDYLQQALVGVTDAIQTQLRFEVENDLIRSRIFCALVSVARTARALPTAARTAMWEKHHLAKFAAVAGSIRKRNYLRAYEIFNSLNPGMFRGFKIVARARERRPRAKTRCRRETNEG